VVEMSLRTFLILASCTALAGCSASDAQITDRGDIQRQARITIPESATNIHCATDADHRGPNAATYGRFDIAKGDLPLVLAGMPGEQKTKPYDGYSNVTSHKMSRLWWQPESLQQKQVADWSMPGYSVNLLIGENGKKDSVTVYFFNFSL
jgi:hypothetical protein